jgi:hypothetical protein
MSAGHSHARAPYGICSTWHPASLGWVPRKWWHPPSLVMPCKLPVGLVLQNRIAQRRKSVALWTVDNHKLFDMIHADSFH